MEIIRTNSHINVGMDGINSYRLYHKIYETTMTEIICNYCARKTNTFNEILYFKHPNYSPVTAYDVCDKCYRDNIGGKEKILNFLSLLRLRDVND